MITAQQAQEKYGDVLTGKSIYEIAQITLQIVDDFDDVLSAETSAIRQGNHEAREDLHPTKVEVGRAYYDVMIGLKDRVEDVKRLDDQMKQRLKFAYDKITTTMDDNMRALEVANTSVQRMQRTIINAAKAAAQDSPAYNAYGSTAPEKDKTVYFQLNEKA